MSRLPDISDFYNLQRATQEDVNWLYTGQYKHEAAFVLPRFEKYGVKTVIEMGCGSGLLATQIPPGIVYTGVDKNMYFLDKARDRNPSRRFLCWCIRNVEEGLFDCVMSFGVLKHVAIDELDTFLAQILKHGRYGAFNVQIATENVDDGVEYHHVHITMQRLQQALAVAGHEIVDTEWTAPEYDLPGGGKGRDLAVWTHSTKHVTFAQLPEEAKVVPVKQGALGQHVDEWAYKLQKAKNAGSMEEAERILVESAEKEIPREVDVASAPQEDGSRPSNDPPRGPSSRSTSYLSIDGCLMTDFDSFTVRFVCEGSEWLPVLYKDGKRVTRAWTIDVQADIGADPSGGNANTAE